MAPAESAMKCSTGMILERGVSKTLVPKGMNYRMMESAMNVKQALRLKERNVLKCVENIIIGLRMARVACRRNAKLNFMLMLLVKNACKIGVGSTSIMMKMGSVSKRYVKRESCLVKMGRNVIQSVQPHITKMVISAIKFTAQMTKDQIPLEQHVKMHHSGLIQSIYVIMRK